MYEPSWFKFKSTLREGLFLLSIDSLRESSVKMVGHHMLDISKTLAACVSWLCRIAFLMFNFASIQSIINDLRLERNRRAIASIVSLVGTSSLNLSLSSSRDLRPVMLFTRVALVLFSSSRSSVVTLVLSIPNTFAV